MYIYIYRERERERERYVAPKLRQPLARRGADEAERGLFALPRHLRHLRRALTAVERDIPYYSYWDLTKYNLANYNFKQTLEFIVNRQFPAAAVREAGNPLV